MTSAEREPSVAPANREPSVLAWLLSNPHVVEVVDYDHVRPRAAAAAYEYERSWARDLVAGGEAVGEARGEARGQARAILTVLEKRSVTVLDEVRDRVLGCTDIGLLDFWLSRAATATTIDDVIRV